MNLSKSPKELPNSSDVSFPPPGFCLIFAPLLYPFHISCKLTCFTPINDNVLKETLNTTINKNQYCVQ